MDSSWYTHRELRASYAKVDESAWLLKNQICFINKVSEDNTVKGCAINAGTKFGYIIAQQTAEQVRGSLSKRPWPWPYSAETLLSHGDICQVFLTLVDLAFLSWLGILVGVAKGYRSMCSTNCWSMRAMDISEL